MLRWHESVSVHKHFTMQTPQKGCDDHTISLCLPLHIECAHDLQSATTFPQPSNQVLRYSTGVNLSFPNSSLWLLLHTMTCIGGIPTLCAGKRTRCRGSANNGLTLGCFDSVICLPPECCHPLELRGWMLGWRKSVHNWDAMKIVAER
jgi:hypothetical protein